MNYLVIEGHKNAAEKFALESGLTPSIDLNSIEERMLIRNDIETGRIQSAIERVNDMDPEVRHDLCTLLISFGLLLVLLLDFGFEPAIVFPLATAEINRVDSRG